MTSIAESPFAVLGVTVHDNRRRILERAEELSLTIEEELCKKSQADLTNPRSRLKCELAWLPGIKPNQVEALINMCEDEPKKVFHYNFSSKISQLNLMTEVFKRLEVASYAQDIVDMITQAGFISTRIFATEVVDIINADRSISGFPAIELDARTESELEERIRACVSAIMGVFDLLPSLRLLEVMTDVVEISTLGGNRPTNTLIDLLVDQYEIETKQYIEKETLTIGKIIELIRAKCKGGENAIQSLVAILEKATKNWDRIAQPIQVSTKARGLRHEPSRNIAYEIRGLAVDLYNQHSMVETVERLNELNSEVFAEVPEIAEKIDEDKEIISDLQQKKF